MIVWCYFSLWICFGAWLCGLHWFGGCWFCCVVLLAWFGCLGWRYTRLRFDAVVVVRLVVVVVSPSLVFAFLVGC